MTSAIGSVAGQAQLADTVHPDDTVYIVNDTKPVAPAIAVFVSKIAKVGSADVCASIIGDATKVVDIPSNMVMPGILKLHTHPFITPWYER